MSIDVCCNISILFFVDIIMKNVLLKLIVAANTLVTIGLLIYVVRSHRIELDISDQILKVRGLVVTDSTGKERVIIGSPLPPAQSFGYRFYRGDNSSVSGIMLYDHEGQERSGYVTDDSYGNVFFTLDSKTSQQALFVAEPQGATALKVWGENGSEINLGASDEGPWLTVSENGKRQNLIREEDNEK